MTDLDTQTNQTSLVGPADHPALLHLAYRTLIEEVLAAPGSLGEVVPTCRRRRIRNGHVEPCGRYACPRCLVVPGTTEIAVALDLARPDYLVTVTQLPSEWAAARHAVHSFVQHLRRRGVDFRWSFSLEPNPSGRGAHAHGWMRGSHLTVADLNLATARTQVGLIHAVETYTSGDPLPYGMKMVQGSLRLPAAEGLAVQAEYLRLNGNRLVHSSNGFWLDPFGQAVGIRQARRWAAKALRTERATDSLHGLGSAEGPA